MVSLLLDTLKPRFFRWSPDSGIWGKRVVLEPGFHVVQAVSGRGKSTLLKSIMGLGSAVDGSVSLVGTQVGPSTVLSYLDQGLACVQALSLQENLSMGLRSVDLDWPRVRQLAHSLGLEPDYQRPCSSLSRGELQRFLLLIALLRPEPWLVLDEPTAHLDPANAALVWEQLKLALAEGRSVLVSSLDPAQEGITKTLGTQLVMWSL